MIFASGQNREDARDLPARQTDIQFSVRADHVLQKDPRLKQPHALRREQADVARGHFLPRPAGTGAIRQRVEEGRRRLVIQHQRGPA
jgi:hypothetical protein